jgi:hypothetical protein
VFERLHDTDAPIFAAPFAEHIRAQSNSHAPVHEVPAGAFRIPSSVLA